MSLDCNIAPRHVFRARALHFVKIFQIICCQEFRDLVMEDATTIREREATDTIQIIDDIRYHIFKVALPGMDVASFDLNADEQLAMLDDLLMQLGLDA